jgi:hypothetical protein
VSETSWQCELHPSSASPDLNKRKAPPRNGAFSKHPYANLALNLFLVDFFLRASLLGRRLAIGRAL